jgi:PII-like signaling protein
MATIQVSVARIYLSEQGSHIRGLLQRLQGEGLRGVTVYRGIMGFGRSGRLHTGALIDLSLDLPLVVEFFDEPPKVEKVLRDLESEFSRGHVMIWHAEMIV